MMLLLRNIEALVIGVVVLIATNYGLCAVLHLQVLSVQSNSMQPLFGVNDAVVTRRASKPLQLGDVIAYKSAVNGQTVTHRLVAFGEQGTLITQGDAVNKADAAVQRSQVLGTVVLIVGGLGRVQQVIRTPLGLIAALAVPMALVLCAEVATLVQRLRVTRYSVAYRN